MALQNCVQINSWNFINANYINHWDKTNYNYGDKYITLGSSSLFVNKKPSLQHKIYYYLKGKIGLNGINMSNEVCKNYLNFIKKKKINYIYGYASAIYILAKYALENNLNININACFPTSEILTELYRESIIKAFSCEIVNCYGAHDGGITAFEHKKGYFEVGYNTIIRLKEKDKNNTGSALLTDLFNYAMPLINYKLGDELQINEEKNNMFLYNGQIINKLLGRTSEIIKLENGRILTGPGFTILFKDISVEYYCIEKTSPNSIICWIIKLPEYNYIQENLIMHTLKKQVGKEIDIKIQETNKPFLNNSGKRQYFKDSTL